MKKKKRKKKRKEKHGVRGEKNKFKNLKGKFLAFLGEKTIMVSDQTQLHLSPMEKMAQAKESSKCSTCYSELEFPLH